MSSLILELYITGENFIFPAFSFSVMAKFVGSLLIIVGTAVGAGMLALPIMSFKLGLIATAALLIFI